MCKKGFWEIDHDNQFGAWLIGFYDDDEFLEAIKLMRTEVNMNVIDYGWKSYEGLLAESIKDGIKAQWKFNNWDDILCETEDCSDESKKADFRSWMRKLFCGLIKYTNPELYTCESKGYLPEAMFLPEYQKLWCINKNVIELSKDIPEDIIKGIERNKIKYVLVDEIKYWGCEI
jgi:hypothetical protein